MQSAFAAKTKDAAVTGMDWAIEDIIAGNPDMEIVPAMKKNNRYQEKTTTKEGEPVKAVRHIAVVVLALSLTLGIPVAMSVDISALFSAKEQADAVSSATMPLPEQPSGEFVVLLNRQKHTDTIAQWQLFFSGGDAGVIMSDVDCRVAQSDTSAMQLARRYQLRLPENQMQLKAENGLLLISKAEVGLFDAIVMSKEMAERYQVATLSQQPDILFFSVKGETP